MRGKHVPERTCRGCGRKAPKQGLVRLVLREGSIEEDSEQVAPGRGVYCCPIESCRKRLEKNKKMLKRVFRVQD